MGTPGTPRRGGGDKTGDVPGVPSAEGGFVVQVCQERLQVTLREDVTRNLLAPRGQDGGHPPEAPGRGRGGSGGGVGPGGDNGGVTGAVPGAVPVPTATPVPTVPPSSADIRGG